MAEKKKTNVDNLGSKFQDVQRKWIAVDQRSPEPASQDHNDSRPKRFPSGSTPVKSLTEKFDGTNGDNSVNESDILRSLVNEQRREIEGLRSQLAVKDERIRQLELRMKETRIVASDFELTKA